MINVDEIKDNNGKSQVKKEPFLFTLEGGRAVLEYMRNMTPQVLIGSIWIVFSLRSLELSFTVKNLIFWLVTLAMMFIFFYLIIANYFNFIKPMTNNIENRITGMQNYKACENPQNLSAWFKHVWRTLCLAYKYEKILFFEFIMIGIFIQIPTVIVIIASANSAAQLYKALTSGFGG